MAGGVSVMMLRKPLETHLYAEKGEGDDGSGGDAADIEAKKKAALEAGAKDKGQDPASKKEANSEDVNSDDPGGWTEKQKSYIDSLRKESAKYRTKSKELDSKVSEVTTKLTKFEKGLKSLFGEGEDENVDPEEKIGQLSQALQAKEVQQTITELAYDNGIPKEDKEYFEFLMMKRLQGLEENEELGEEDIAEIAKQAKGRKLGASSVGAGLKPGSEGSKGTGEIGLEQFKKMSITEKSALYGKSPELYERLMQESKVRRQTL